MSRHSVRVRIAAWYSLVLAVVLVGAGAVTYAVARKEMQRSTDRSILTTVRNLDTGLTDEASEGAGTLRPRAANELLTEFRDNDRAIVLFTADGRPFAAHTTTPLARSLDRSLLRQRVVSRAFGFSTLPTAGVRLFLAPIRIGPESFVIAVAQSLPAQEKTLDDLRQAMFITAPLALLVASLGGYILARKSLGPVARITAKARAISANSLSERIEVVNPRDELGELAGTLNELLARLERSFIGQRRFMADASHELRSPVTILQGELDVTLSREDRDAAAYRESLEVMQRSVGRLTRIVRDLFLLARSDAGDVPLNRQPLYLGELVAQTVRASRTVAAERQVALVAGCDDEIVLRGDEDLLQRMIGNLLENAIRHAPAGTAVDIRCRAVSAAPGGEARITVSDAGPGVPEALREQIFERFFRVDAARGATAAPTGSGAGLGLPIARWIAEAHGGTLRLERSDAAGSIFTATLPLRPHAFPGI